MRAQDAEAIEPRHLEVEDHAVHRLARQHLERLDAVRRREHVEAAEALQVVRVLPGHGGNVVDHEHAGHEGILARVDPASGRAAGVATPAQGSTTVTCVPRPGALSTATAPPRSIVRRRTTESPSPVPSARVV